MLCRTNLRTRTADDPYKQARQRSSEHSLHGTTVQFGGGMHDITYFVPKEHAKEAPLLEHRLNRGSQQRRPLGLARIVHAVAHELDR